MTLDSSTPAVDLDPEPRYESAEQLFRSCAHELVRSLALMEGRELAEDAVQEAFVQAHLRWAKVGRYDDPMGWVRRVAINRLRNGARWRRRRDALVNAIGSNQAPSSLADQSTDTVALQAALRDLSPQQRAAIVLRFFDGLPVAEVAAAMTISEGTASQHLHRARTKLRTILGEQDNA